MILEDDFREVNHFSGLFILISFFLPLFLSILCFIRNPKSVPRFTLLGLGGHLLCLSLAPLFFETPSRFLFQWFSLSPQFPIVLGLTIDATNLTTGILVAAISGLVGLFSWVYMAKEAVRYWVFLSLFVAGMQTFVFAPTLIQTYLGWELLGISSFFLIGFWFTKQDNARAAINAFWVNRIGDVFLLLGIVLFYFYGPTLIFPIIDESQSLASSTWLTVALAGVALAGLTKAAQFPFQVWLPWAMAGPTPISALMHAATLVAAGVLLLIRFYPLFPSFILEFLFGVGFVSALSGALIACCHADAKKVLAFSTISQLGLMVMALGLGGSTHAYAHFFTHAIFKAGLFLALGSLVYALHQWQERVGLHFDSQLLSNLGGLRKLEPIFTAFWCILLANLMGLPFTAGGYSKSAIAALVWVRYDSGSLPGGFFSLIGILILFSLTAFYVTRLYLLICEGKGWARRWDNEEKTFTFPRLLIFPVFFLALISFLVPYFLPHLFYIEGSGARWYVSALSLFTIGIGSISAVLLFRKQKLDAPLGKKFNGWAINHFYLSGIFYSIFIKTSLFFSNFLYFIEKNIVDKFFIVLAKLFRYYTYKDKKYGISLLFSFIDSRLLDIVIKTFYLPFWAMGYLLRLLQNGNTQSYMLYSLIAFLLIALLML
jgi:NADH-quinone oxidoreductase subunit L